MSNPMNNPVIDKNLVKNLKIADMIESREEKNLYNNLGEKSIALLNDIFMGCPFSVSKDDMPDFIADKKKIITDAINNKQILKKDSKALNELTDLLLKKCVKIKVLMPHTPSDEPPPNVIKKYSPHSPLDAPPLPPLNAPLLLEQELGEQGQQEGEYIDEDVEETNVPEQNPNTKQQSLNKLIQTYYALNPFYKNDTELEVRFGTLGVKQINSNDYDNVIKCLKSYGFYSENQSGEYMMRINCEYLDNITGRFKLSDIRAELNGLKSVEIYCKTDDIKEVIKQQPFGVNFYKKSMITNPDKSRIMPIDFNDFNFRVSLQSEEDINRGRMESVKRVIISNWSKSKKIFRYINRVTFIHKDNPFKVDLSIVKSSNRNADKFGRANRGPMVKTYTISESNVFNNDSIYEIEIEVDNLKIGPGTEFNTPEKITESLRKVIKFVLSGLQGTSYPISYPEQTDIINSYMTMIWGDEYDSKRRVTSKNFIGPKSITLQLTNICPIDKDMPISESNIRKNYVVTDKADGERHLMYISSDGKIYLINTNMDVKFTGAKTFNKACFKSLLDGELILHDKNKKFINLFAAFDIYYLDNKDVRGKPFMPIEQGQPQAQASNKMQTVDSSRYTLLKDFIQILEPVSIMDVGHKTRDPKTSVELLEQFKGLKHLISPIIIKCKEFYPVGEQTIFEGCKTILEKSEQNRIEYNTDGLIFTPSFLGVGSDQIGKPGPKNGITWEHSFKWKPPQYNTIDFLVTTLKNSNGNDLVTPLFETGINTDAVVQLNEYKSIELRCGFSEKMNGFINPCQDIYQDRLPEYVRDSEDKPANDYMPQRFYPTEPYDPNAGLCNIMLALDDAGNKQMFTLEGEVFGDNTIVEFSYNFDREEGWRWIPLRVRYDKTAKLMRGENEFGNSYRTCNENWKSIHPEGRITEDMLMTGLGMPDVSTVEDKYYNTPAGKMKTEALKNFHNLYVKQQLIKGVSKQGDTLIDFACGKAGDLPKWIAAKLSFVFGIDYSSDNLENRLDGACARFLKARRKFKNMPYALFVHGNSAFNIKDGGAMLNDKAKQISAAIFGRGPKEESKLGKGVARQYGKGESGFNISSCQFAMHYFFENPDTLKGFLRNIAECTRVGGHFIGTAYDGKMVFNELRKSKLGESVQIMDDGKKIWEIIKGYGEDSFEDNSSSIGYRIDVFQESINQTITEYLINFDYFERLMDAYGFKLVTREEANEMGFPEGTGLFSELFINMLDQISKNKFKANDYGLAQNMTSFEKRISFLNRYFIYKKVMEVNLDKIQLEFSEYDEATEEKEVRATKRAIDTAKDEERILKPKVKKLSKKLLLVPATEASNEPSEKKAKAKTPAKTKIIIESDSEEED